MRRPTLLICSLIGNVALGAVLFGLHRQRTEKPLKTASVVTSTPAKATVLEDKVWSEINDKADDTAFVTRLRQLGFPEHIVRLMIGYRIEQKYADQIRALMNSEQTPYWRRGSFADSISAEALEKLQSIRRTISDQTRFLLGANADLYQPGDYGRSDSRRFGSLSYDKIATIKAIEDDYSDLSDKIENATQGIRFPEDREKLAYLEKQKQADLAQLLTPEELEDYERRSSSAAYSTRRALLYLDGTTEEEFLKLYSLQHDFDQYHGRNYLSPEQESQRRAAKNDLEAQIKSALGAERYAEYQIVNDNNFEPSRDFALTNGLTASTAKTLTSLRRDFIQQAESVAANKSLTDAQRNESYQALEQTLRKNLTTYLGDEKYALYQKSNAGSWLTQLASSKSKGGK